MKLEVDLEPAPFAKRVSQPPYARGSYNSEEWVFDDYDEDEEAMERCDYGHDDEPQHHVGADLPANGIRSLEVAWSSALEPGLGCVLKLNTAHSFGLKGQRGLFESQCKARAPTHSSVCPPACMPEMHWTDQSDLLCALPIRPEACARSDAPGKSASAEER